MLQKLMIPLGVDGGTRSSAAERMMTYKTGTNYLNAYARRQQILTIVDKPKEKKGDAKLNKFLLPACSGGMSTTSTTRKENATDGVLKCGHTRLTVIEHGDGPGWDQHPRFGTSGALPCVLSDDMSSRISSWLRIRTTGMSWSSLSLLGAKSCNSTVSGCCKRETAVLRAI